MWSSESYNQLTQIVGVLIVCGGEEVVRWEFVVVEICMVGDEPTQFGDLFMRE